MNAHPTVIRKATERRDKYALLAEAAEDEVKQARMEGYAAGLTLAIKYMEEGVK